MSCKWKITTTNIVLFHNNHDPPIVKSQLLTDNKQYSLLILKTTFCGKKRLKSYANINGVFQLFDGSCQKIGNEEMVLMANSNYKMQKVIKGAITQ